MIVISVHLDRAFKIEAHSGGSSHWVEIASRSNDSDRVIIFTHTKEHAEEITRALRGLPLNHNPHNSADQEELNASIDPITNPI